MQIITSWQRRHFTDRHAIEIIVLLHATTKALKPAGQRQQAPNQRQKTDGDAVTFLSQQAEKFREIKKTRRAERKTANRKEKISFAGCNKIWSSIYKATQFCCLVLLSVSESLSASV